MNFNPLKFEEVVEACAKVWDVKVSDIIQTKQKNRKIINVEPRNTAITLLANNYRPTNYDKLSSLFNLKDRAIVYNSIKRFNEWFELDPKFREKVFNTINIINKQKEISYTINDTKLQPKNSIKIKIT